MSSEWWEKYQVSHIPAGISGDWAVEKFSVSYEESERTKLTAMRHGEGYVAPGDYTRLKHGNALIMSDTPDEISSNQPPISCALTRGGHILIAGLGLGMVTRGVLMSEKVTRVTVVEISPDVIKLVAPYMEVDSRLKIVEADIHKWRVPRNSNFTFAWFDIWGDYTSADIAEMDRLKRRFRKWADSVACWQEHRCRILARYGRLR